jgi:hypothetical protein
MRRYLPAALVVLSFAALPDVARAVTWNVTTQQDGVESCTGHSCSTLRAAVGAAGAGDTVMLPASSSHYIVNQEISVTKPLTIEGASGGSSVVDAGGHSRVFEITSGVSNTQTVNLKDLTITGGKLTTLTPTAPGGAGIAVDQSAGNLVLVRVVVTGNAIVATSSNGAGTRLAGGGGILENGGMYDPMTSTVIGGNLTLIRSLVSHNRVRLGGDGDAPGGGGIKTDGGNTTVFRSIVSANTVNDTAASGDDQGGGGIESRGKNTTLRFSAVSGNTVTTSASSPVGSGGGGINNQGDSLIVIASTISGNTANVASAIDAGGGGVFDGEQHPVWVNSTVSGNKTNVPAGTRTGGGGIYLAYTKAARLTNVTVVRNSSANAPGGGIFAAKGAAQPMLKGSIVGLNHSGTGRANCAGGATFLSLGYNLETDAARTCGFTKATDVLSARPHLGPLGNHGGPTATVSLGRHSPAIDRIPLASCTDQGSPTPKRLSTDQRGRLRPDGKEKSCDIGSYESR